MAKAIHLIGGQSEVKDFNMTKLYRIVAPEHMTEWERLIGLPVRYAPDWAKEKGVLIKGYTGWGPNEDYLAKEGASWDCLVELTPEEFIDKWQVDDLNFPVDFYFSLTVGAQECAACNGEGLNQETSRIKEEWYGFHNEHWVKNPYRKNSTYNNNAWEYHLEEPEVVALLKSGRLSDVAIKTTAVQDGSRKTRRYRFDEERNQWIGTFNIDGKIKTLDVNEPEFVSPDVVNEWAKKEIMSHDGINAWICIKSKAKRLGVFGHCKHCEGDGRIVLTEPRIDLSIWWAHPRKGATRALVVEGVEEKHITQIKEIMRKGAEANLKRFNWAM